LAQLVPMLLELVKTTPNPDQTIENLSRISAAVGGRATFYDLLANDAKLLRLVIDLSGWATYLVNLLGEVPGLPDELLDTLTRAPRRPDLLVQEARHLVHGITELEPPLRFFQARELAAIAVRDLDGWPQKDVVRQLSHLAVAILNVVVERCTVARAREWGLPEENHRQTRFTVIGLGKLGSRSLSYASDMDVIFACDPGGRCRGSDHDGEQFWTRTAQEVMRVLGEGHLYDIDPRLRPWGDQSELVPNIASLTRYWTDPRDMWERMAMLRAAYIAGDPSLGNECISLIRTAALGAPLPSDAAHQVRDMRRRLEDSVAGRDHVKRGWGGYVDHEFIAQYLSFGVPPRDLAVGCATIDTLARLGELGRIPTEAVVELSRSYEWLRFVEARGRLSAGKAVSSIPTDAVSRLELAKRCKKPDLASFDLEMHDARQNARKWFDRLVV
jgi:glutamate-ammonia-ligase adenylyltransferase